MKKWYPEIERSGWHYSWSPIIQSLKGNEIFFELHGVSNNRGPVLKYASVSPLYIFWPSINAIIMMSWCDDVEKHLSSFRLKFYIFNTTIPFVYGLKHGRMTAKDVSLLLRHRYQSPAVRSKYKFQTSFN